MYSFILDSPENRKIQDINPLYQRLSEKELLEKVILNMGPPAGFYGIRHTLEIFNDEDLIYIAEYIPADKYRIIYSKNKIYEIH